MKTPFRKSGSKAFIGKTKKFYRFNCGNFVWACGFTGTEKIKKQTGERLLISMTLGLEASAGLDIQVLVHQRNGKVPGDHIQTHNTAGTQGINRLLT